MVQITGARKFTNPREARLPLSVAESVAEAQALIDAGRHSHAEAYLRQWISAEPMSGEAHQRIGALRLAAGRPGEAYEHYKIAATQVGERSDVWFEFGRCLEMMRQFEAAGVAFGKAIEIGPATPEMHMAMGRVHRALGRSEDAVAAIDAALRLKPGDVDALFLRANQLQMSGDFSGARDGYLDVLTRDPRRVDAHFWLADMGEVAGREDVVVDGLLAAANAPDTSVERQAVAIFAAASVRRKQSAHDQAFALAARANALYRSEALFDRSELTALIDRQIACFDAETFKVHQGLGDLGELPVFIVGMPRSGSTLVEQVISSHPEVGAAGEFGKLQHLEAILSNPAEGARYCYPDDLKMMDFQKIRPFANQYLETLVERGGEGHQRITDKSLFNFLHLGLIALLFPKAVVIHCRRDARDLGLSCFFQKFSALKTLAFTHDLGDIGFYIREYRRMMAHWQAVLPLAILDIDYEDMVARQEEVSRQAIAHTGLEWNEACLRPQENRRAVKTASTWQVRQPVYGSSVGVWRNYEAHLEPLLAELSCET
ncbi:hypothetical protein MNBD_ALPHA09-291 [hydrothermal vent metagenome]|uniref:Uncharacterized protein n=1 Tax=hydrothermal vent metagenome TaxID=652676 RepID=A0A3B0TX99_9ZZZZ